MPKKKNLIIKPRFYIFLLVIIIFIIIMFIPKNYEKTYKLEEFNIIEKYDNQKNRYNLSISKEDNIFDYNFTNKYIGKKIIKDIQEYSNDNTYCIEIDIDNYNVVPLCIKDNMHIDSSLVDDFDFNKDNNINSDYQTYDNINVYNLLNKDYLIWNYHEFIYLNSDGKQNIELFNSDYYNIDLALTIKNYLVIPNYDSMYNFKELILINLDNLKKETWNLNYEISFESYILGTYENDIYIVDKKNKLEYKLDIKRREMKIVGTEERNGIILNNGTFESISMYKLVNNILSFTYDYDQYYFIENNKLYLNTLNNKILISNNADTIVYQNDNYVFYLVGDSLFYYDTLLKEIKIMESFEWNFNSNNIIFINTFK